MAYEQYLPVNVFDVITHTVFWGLVVGASFGLITGIVCLIRRSANKKKTIAIVALIGASWGMWDGFLEGSDTVDARNLSILSSNVSKKYDVQEINLGYRVERPRNDSPKEKPTMKDAQDVTVVSSSGKYYELTLVQDKNTNEPTLLDMKTQTPHTDLLRSNNKD